MIMLAFKARWEKFCQLIARGACNSNADAYLAAGFKSVPRDVAKVRAYQLLQKPAITERVEQIRAELEQEHRVARTAAIEATALTREFVINELLDNLKRAKSGKKIDGATANRACELLGKELGMFVDRSENTNTIYGISDKPLTPEEWEKKWTEKQAGEQGKSVPNVDPGNTKH